MGPYDVSAAGLERDCDVEFFNSGGPGGQHRNKTETGVRLRHRPSGVGVTATERRSRSQNLSAAYERMRERLVKLMTPPPPRVPTKPSKATKRRRLESKRRRAETKRSRRYLGD